MRTNIKAYQTNRENIGRRVFVRVSYLITYLNTYLQLIFYKLHINIYLFEALSFV